LRSAHMGACFSAPAAQQAHANKHSAAPATNNVVSALDIKQLAKETHCASCTAPCVATAPHRAALTRGGRALGASHRE